MKGSRAILFKHPLLLYALFLLVAYLPVFLPFFHLKNDLISQNLPTRFVISESIYSGYFPWWNPYIHFGIPQYGDMNNGFWNPLIWIISNTTGYNIWTITLEEMFYILAGGWGIYKVCREFLTKETSLLTGLSYMACGYMLGHLQHFCWITGTAFFPYVLLFFIRVNKQAILKNFVFGAFAIFLFLASTHPGLIIGGLYFFLFLFIFIFVHRKGVSHVLYGGKFLRRNLLFLLFGALVSTVIIVSNIDVLQHITRGGKLSREQMLLNPTTLQSYFSLLFPLPVHASAFFETDISMRNVYIGLAGCCGLLLFIKKQTRKTIISIAIPLFFFILLSSGGVFKTFFSKIFPFTGYVRMNGEFTYFAILILIFAGAAGIDSYLVNENPGNPFRKSLRFLQWLFAGSAILAILYILFHPYDAGLRQLFKPAGDFRKTIKYLINNLSFPYLVFIESMFQLVTVALLRKYFPKRAPVAAVLLLNLIVHCWLILPYTGLGTRSKREFDRTVTVFEKGIHAPELRSVKTTRYLDSSLLPDVWLISSYSKKIGYVSEESYPVQLNSTARLFADPALFKFIIQQSYLFLSTDTSLNALTSFDSSRIRVQQFSPGYIKASISNKEYTYLTFLQNDYPYWTAKINGREKNHFTGFKTFLTTRVPAGDFVVEFIFDPYPIRWALLTSVLFLIIGGGILLKRTWTHKLLFP